MGLKEITNFFNQDKNWPKIFWGIFLLITIISLVKLFNSSPINTHDNNYAYWLSAFDNIIKSGQLLPSWVKDFWFEHGSPLFIFYPPLFFYLAEIPRLVGFSLISAVEVVIGLSFLASFFGIYLLVKEIWGKWSGLFAGLIYMVAPYHFALIYIRGAYAENLAYALFPFGLWFIYKIFQNGRLKKYIIGLSFTIGLIILTNIPATVLYGILILLWIIILFIQYKKIPIVSLIVGFLGSLGLSAFYWIPAFLNKELIQSDFFFSKEYVFSNYFTSIINYLPNQSWSKSEFFQWGILAWVVILLAIIYLYQNNKKQVEQNNKLVWLLLSGLVITVFLMTKFSYVLWDSSAIIRYIQFPYRLLSVVSVFTSIIGGYVVYRTVGFGKLILLFLIIIQANTFSRLAVEFRDDIYKQDTTYTVYGDIKAQLIITPQEDRNEKGTPEFVKTHTAEDGYLPINVNPEEIKTHFVNNTFSFLSPMSLQASAKYTLPDSKKIITEGTISNVTEEVESISFIHSSNQANIVQYIQSGFPGWKVFVDNREINWELLEGRISFTVPAGQHNIKIKYVCPLGATTGRVISLLSLIVVIMFLFWFKKPISHIENKGLASRKNNKIHF